MYGASGSPGVSLMASWTLGKDEQAPQKIIADINKMTGQIDLRIFISIATGAISDQSGHLSRRMSQSSTTAPTVADTSEPINPNEMIPSRRNRNPPTSAPRIPTTRSPTRPKPRPRIIFPESHPATIPIMRNQNQCTHSPVIIKIFLLKFINISEGQQEGISGKSADVKPANDSGRYLSPTNQASVRSLPYSHHWQLFRLQPSADNHS